MNLPFIYIQVKHIKFEKIQLQIASAQELKVFLAHALGVRDHWLPATPVDVVEKHK